MSDFRTRAVLYAERPWCDRCDHGYWLHAERTAAIDSPCEGVGCDCNAFRPEPPPRWWQKEIGFKVWVLIAVILINLVASVVHGAYIGWNSARDLTCVTVRHDIPSDDYVVCGEKQAVHKDFD